MHVLRLLLASTLVVGLSACNDDSKPDTSLRSCFVFYDPSVLDIGSDVTTDFSANGLTLTLNVRWSNCSGITGTRSTTVNVARTGNQIILTDTNGNTTALTIASSVIIPEQSEVATNGNCVQQTTYSGSLNTSTDQVSLTIAFGARELALNGCAGIM